MSDADHLAATAVHAARGKAAAVAQGYWQDKFAHRLTHGDFEGSSINPLIDRGQYARVAAVGSVCEQFIAATAGEPSQIVSLGAGFDTCFWQLQAAGASPRLFIEIDQLDIVRRKCTAIATVPALRAALPDEAAADEAALLALKHGSSSGIRSGSSGYRLLAVDLNSVAELEAALASVGWDPQQPTLVLAECVLVYMVPSASAALLSLFGRRCARAVLVAYEMVGPDDPFGRTMLDNLRRRGCPLLGLQAVPDCRAQEARCMRCGWQRAEALEMLPFFEQVVDAAERKVRAAARTPPRAPASTPLAWHERARARSRAACPSARPRGCRRAHSRRARRSACAASRCSTSSRSSAC